jgi:hypothetical protein
LDFTWGFLVLFALFIIPGLIIRRLYFYGEFSKQFGYSEPLLKTTSYAIIPGIINAICAFYIFDYFFLDIDLGVVIDSYKSLSDPAFKYQESEGEPIKLIFTKKVFPFLAFTYLSAIIIGLLSGRLVRMTSIDTKWKLFRFKNQWFYLFNGYHVKLEKYKFLKTKNKRFLFTQADVLIDTNEGSKLYSGFIVDYELRDSDIRELSKIVLKNPSRYSSNSTGKRISKSVPGNLLVVDCTNLLNINLTFVYGQAEEFLKSTYAKIINRFFSVISILIIPIFIFQLQWVKWSYYISIFDLSVVGRIFYYLFVIQVIQIFNPVIEKKNSKQDFQWIDLQSFFVKIILAAVTFGIAWLVEKIINLIF